jgi:hypothetical protein
MTITLDTKGWFDERVQNFVGQLKAGYGIHAYKICGEHAVEAHPKDSGQEAVVNSLYGFYSGV